MCYTYDEILASAYYVFRDDLKIPIICTSLEILTKYYGIKFSRTNLQIVKLKNIIIFENETYKLNSSNSIDDIIDYVVPCLVIFFETLKRQQNSSYDTLKNENLDVPETMIRSAKSFGQKK